MAIAGIATKPSSLISPPRIASAPISMECQLYESVEARTSTIILAHVTHFHIADEFIDAQKRYVDTPAMNMVARMHGAGWYARGTDRFLWRRPSFAEWSKNSGRFTDLTI